jgi:hypothetical protein
MEDKVSQAVYGTFEDKFEVSSVDSDLVTLKAAQHLSKFSGIPTPLIKGSISPTEGYYRAGEMVDILIPTLSINDRLKITQANYTSSPGKFDMSIELETEYDTRLVLKEIRNSIKRLEEDFEQDAPVEQIANIFETLTISDSVSYTTQTPGTFLVGTARVGFCDAG